jgi:hypothetical protein
MTTTKKVRKKTTNLPSSKPKSLLERAKEIPKGKFRELTKLLEPHEFVKHAVK